MNIHEYQGKALLARYGVAVPAGGVVDDVGKAEEVARSVSNQSGSDGWVVKAQIHAGGRGKGGGVKVAANIPELLSHVNAILGMQLVTHQTGPEGKKVNKVLIEENIYKPGKNPVLEFYLGILLNRSTGRINVMYSTKGGMDIETVAEKTPELIFKEEIHPAVGLQSFQSRKIAFNLGLKGSAFKDMVGFLPNLYKAYLDLDASLVEINPLVKTSDERIVAVDTKINLDDNALFRHPDFESLHDPAEENESELEAVKYNLNFVKLNGNVGCMVNGAGLAMATMDIIKLSGGEPANFLDVGGTANAQTVEAGFRIILKDPNVKAILINIFGGIVRCDRVAEGVTEAFKSLGEVGVPVIVRLQGTNAKEAKDIIDHSGFKVFSAISLQDAADRVKEILGH